MSLYLSNKVRSALGTILLLAIAAPPLHAQDRTPDLQQRVDQLEKEVAELKAMVLKLQPAAVSAAPAAGQVQEISPPSPSPGLLNVPSIGEAKIEESRVIGGLRGTTIDVGLDTYYEYNLNRPVGQVNLLRAYDVLSNSFSLNQASVIFDHPADASAGHKFGARLDLQFGQATDTLQGNKLNEPRPDIYRNIYQAYGTFKPTDKLSMDFGKWSSSLGVEGNYTKDQMNYTRSYYFNFLPFYHMGVRASYQATDRLALNYWIVNGTNQVEATNGFKDEMFGFTAKPRQSVTWTVNYYLGQENPNRNEVTPTSPIPVQPGLSFQAITPAPNGRLHIFDSYATWLANPRLTFILEGDYVINRIWQNSTPTESSAPSDVSGGAAYMQYRFTPKFALATRAEYLRDNGGLFSGLTQSLKEGTVTFDHKVENGFLIRYEFRHDWSNQPTFLTRYQGQLRESQTTATAGVIWWFGGKKGAW